MGKDSIIKVWTKFKSKYCCSLILSNHATREIVNISVKNNTIYSYCINNKIRMWDIDTGTEKYVIPDIKIMLYHKSVFVLENGDIVCDEMINFNFYQLVVIHFINSNDFIKRVVDTNSSFCYNIQLLPDHRIMAGFNDGIIKIYDINSFILNLCQFNSNDSKNSIDLRCSFDEMHFSNKTQVTLIAQNHKFIIYEDKRLITLHANSTMFIWK